jgi:hypothetical protein
MVGKHKFVLFILCFDRRFVWMVFSFCKDFLHTGSSGFDSHWSNTMAIFLNLLFMENSDQIKNRLINDILNGKDSEHVDMVLKDTLLTDQEKYHIIKDIQPYHVHFLTSSTNRKKGISYLIIAVFLTLLGLVLLPMGILAYGAVLVAIYMGVEGIKLCRRRNMDDKIYQPKLKLFNKTPFRRN